MTVVTYPTAPAVTPLAGTLLDIATVTDDFANLGSVLGDNEALYSTFNCMKFEAGVVFCGANSKTFDNTPVWQHSFTFGAYGGVTCSAVGLDRAEMEAQARAAFERGESIAIERAFMETRFREGPSVDPMNDDAYLAWDAPTDITPSGGAVSPKVGMALLEGFAAQNYSGQPTIHIPRTVASLLLGVDGADFDGQTLRTKLGAKIAAGAGYEYPNTGPDGTAAAAGEAWLYATGEVFLGRGPVEVRQAIAFEDNDVLVLAERPYIGAADCFTAAIRVTLTA
jgi:hypothetical protein